MSEVIERAIKRLELLLFEVKEAAEDGDEHSAVKMMYDLGDEAKTMAQNVVYELNMKLE